jgi:hypothetical protein
MVGNPEFCHPELWSVWDVMEQFLAHELATVFWISGQANGCATTGGRLTVALQEALVHFGKSREEVSQVVDAASRLGTWSALEPVIQQFERLPLSTVARAKFKRIIEEAKDGKCSSSTIETLLRELLFDTVLELTEPMFFCVKASHRALYEQREPPFGDIVETTFPDSKRDVAAAARCLALDEWTACVFHLMRVLEHGLRKMAARFGVPFATDSWHRVIKGIEDGISDLRNKPSLTDLERREITYYSEAASQFRHIKDAWRNHVSHAREHYDERDANSVCAHVKELMQHLTTNP